MWDKVYYPMELVDNARNMSCCVTTPTRCFSSSITAILDPSSAIMGSASSKHVDALTQYPLSDNAAPVSYTHLTLPTPPYV